MAKLKILNAPSIKRLPSYLLVAKRALANGQKYISGTSIAQELEFEPIQVRKDLGITELTGKPKRGYPVLDLIEKVEEYLNWNSRVEAIVIGAGNLGSALSGFPGFKEHGLYFVAAFDADPAKKGTIIHGAPVYMIEELAEVIQKLHVEVALLTVPPSCAQEITNKLVSCGIKAIWNFTNTKLKVPDNIIVQNEDLSSGYAMLSMKYKLKKQSDEI